MILSNRFSEAPIYAAELHATQIRKGSGVRYIAHLLGTASIALEYGASEDEPIAALLHDAIANGGGPPTREAIRRRFGDTVTAIDRILIASSSVKLVSAADKLYNVRSILKYSRQSIRRYCLGTLQRQKRRFSLVLSFVSRSIPPS